MDIVDYVDGGFIGCNENINVPTKDLDWDSAYITFNNTKDAYFKSLHEFVGSNRASMVSFLGPADENTIYSVSGALDLEGHNILASEIQSLGQKILNFEEKSRVFWNTLLSEENKKTNIEIIEITNFKQTGITLNINNSDDLMESISLTIDYSDKQQLTSKIYTEYLDSLNNLMFQIKTIFILLTGSTLQYFTP